MNDAHDNAADDKAMLARFGPRPLSKAEKDTFELIRNIEGGRIALIQTAFDGEQTAVICLVCGDDEVTVHPLAVLVTENMFGRLVPPNADFTPFEAGR